MQGVGSRSRFGVDFRPILASFDPNQGVQKWFYPLGWHGGCGTPKICFDLPEAWFWASFSYHCGDKNEILRVLWPKNWIFGSTHFQKQQFSIIIHGSTYSKLVISVLVAPPVFPLVSHSPYYCHAWFYHPFTLSYVPSFIIHLFLGETMEDLRYMEWIVTKGEKRQKH